MNPPSAPGPDASPGSAAALAEAGILKVRWHARLDKPPPRLAPAAPDADRIDGMLLGLAIGDALGNTSESQTATDRRMRHGHIHHYLPNRHAGGRSIGLPSDDTQLAFRLLRQLVEDGELIPSRLASHLANGRIFGIGRVTRQFVAKHAAGVPWQIGGGQGSGNGALMRIAPVVLPHLAHPSERLWHDTLLAAHVTHDDALSNACCVAFVHLLWQLLHQTEAPEQDWWIDEFAAVLDDIARELAPPLRVRKGEHRRLQDLLRDEVRPALGLDAAQAGQRWWSGAYLMETVPSVLHILARHGTDPQAALLEAVNQTWDNDSVAAIVGAAVGALHGASALPQPWISDLSGRLGADDDGAVFELMQRAGRRFGYGSSPTIQQRWTGSNA